MNVLELFLAATTTVLVSAAGATPSPKTEIAWKQPDKDSLRPIYGIKWKHDFGQFELFATNHEEWTRPAFSEDGHRVYIGARSGRLEARSFDDGKLLWARNDLGTIGASMIEFDNGIVVGSDSDLLSLDRTRGKERWRLALGGRIGGQIARSGKIAILPLRPNAFAAVDLSTGQRLWQVKRTTPEGLTVRGQAEAAIDSQQRLAYLGFSDGVLVAVNIDSGASRWVASLGDRQEFFADIDTRPVLLDEGKSLIVAAFNSGLFRVEARSGAVEWSKPLKQITALQKTSGGLVVASQGGSGQVIGMIASDGQVRWRYKLQAGAPGIPAMLSKFLVAVPSNKSSMSILDTRNGQPIQLIAPGTGMSVTPAVSGRDIVILSNGGLALGLRRDAGGHVLIR